MGDRYKGDLDPFVVRTTSFRPAINLELGIEMAINGAFGGTPETIHNGTDTAAYTGSNVVGNKITFDSTDVFTGWPTTGAMSIEANKPIIGDIWQFDRGSDVDLSNFVAFTLRVIVISGWTLGNSIKIYGYDTGTGLQVGNSVLVEQFINEQVIDTVQKVSIPLTDMGLEASTIDAIRIEVVAKSGPGIVFYADDIQIEETSGARIFLMTAPQDTIFRVTNVNFTYISPQDSTLANNSMPNIDHETIMGIPKLTNGTTFNLILGGNLVFDTTVRSFSDHMKGGSTLTNVYGDATSTNATVVTRFSDPVDLDSRIGDAIGIIINDDLSSLTSFTALAQGFTVKV